jgi:hypothetical protein
MNLFGLQHQDFDTIACSVIRHSALSGMVPPAGNISQRVFTSEYRMILSPTTAMILSAMAFWLSAAIIPIKGEITAVFFCI